jgi:AraC-like DNA-binding protein
MASSVFAPHRALQPYIACYAHYEIGADDGWTRADLIPAGSAAMSISIGGTRPRLRDHESFEPVAFVGQVTHFRPLWWYSRTSIFHVAFRPWGAYALLGMPQHACTDLFANLSDLPGSPATSFGKTLAGQTDPETVRRLLDGFFLKCLAQQHRADASIRLAPLVEQLGRCSHQRNIIGRICREAGYSISRCERHMNEIVGLGPKQYQRIMRFNAALAYMRRNPLQRNWCWIADQFGYFDQAHFIKEFKSFYGKTPAECSPGDRYISDLPTAPLEPGSRARAVTGWSRRPRARRGTDRDARYLESAEFFL